MAFNFAPIGVYTNVVNIISAASKAEIVANLNIMLALLPDSANGDGQGASPDFGDLNAAIEQKIRAELAAFIAAVNAAPEV